MSGDKIILVKDKVKAGVKHSALTGFLRRNWTSSTIRLQQIVYNCNVSPYLGALPPELRKCVSHDKIGQVTQQFRENLENFLIQNVFEIRDMDADKIYEIPALGDLFNTKCVLETKGINVYGVNPWAGAVGFVCKLSFPEINAHYALKLFFDRPADWATVHHGPWFEISTAFAANHAQPRDNNPIYMASLKYDKYMLSKWAGDVQDGIAGRYKDLSVFKTSVQENGVRNRRNGRMIDWGETFLSGYGRLSYAGRKLVRQILAGDEIAVENSWKRAVTDFDKEQMKIASCFAREYINSKRR